MLAPIASLLEGPSMFTPIALLLEGGMLAPVVALPERGGLSILGRTIGDGAGIGLDHQPLVIFVLHLLASPLPHRALFVQ